MTTLAAQQQALLHALFDWPMQDAVRQLGTHVTGVGSHPNRGFKAYQANGHMLAERALAAAYPVLQQMLGEASFSDLARAFWHAQPPERGDIAQWGDALAEFLRGNPQLQDTPYLPDVVLAEWALHRCATAQDRQADPATLALLTTDDPQALTLVLAPGTSWVCSQWPLADLLLAHLEGTPSFAEVATQLQRQAAQDAVIWRSGFQSKVRLALPGETALLGALQTGMALEAALDCTSTLDFPQWLPLAVQTGLVLGVRPLSTNL